MDLYASTVLADSPALYLRMGELSGTDATDSSGNGLASGVFSGGYTLGMAGAIVGSNNAAVLYNGSTGGISGVGAAGSLSFIQNTLVFWISFWLKLTDHAAVDETTILSNNNGSTGGKGIYLAWANSGGAKQVRAMIARGVGGLPAINSYSDNDAITDNDKHHVVVTGDGTNVAFYVDGVAKGGSAIENPLSTGDSSTALYVARFSGGGNFGGLLDELAIGNTTLSAGRVLAHYEVGTYGRAGRIIADDAKLSAA